MSNIKDLLKEVLALHGWSGYGKNGLIDREVTHEGVKGHICNAETMDKLDERIKEYLEGLHPVQNETNQNKIK
tara:strand:- start:273 stop:491 length:219 start_codon:yes stop_codon:yes gene_type:complete